MIGAVLAQVRRSLHDRQTRAGLDLVSSAALNAATGLGFWFVATQWFDEATVGVNATLLSTMAFIVALSSLGLRAGLIRFIPIYGSRASSLVLRSYAITLATAFVAAPIAAVVLIMNSEGMEVLSSFLGIAGFTVATLFWMAFVLQDSVLVGLGETRVIPVENGAHAILKVILLLLFGFLRPTLGIFIASVLPVVVIVVVINRYVFRKLAEQNDDVAEASPGPALVRFATGEHLGSLLDIALVGLLPVIVLASAGDDAAAFYAIAWAISYNLHLVNSNISDAFLAEASKSPARLGVQTAKAIRQMSVFVVPGALFLFVAGPLVLRIFGASYASEATPLLRLLSLAAIPNILAAAAFGVLRATRQVAVLVAYQVLYVVVVAGLGITLLLRYGVTGLGVGWLAGEVAVALVAMVFLLRPVLLLVVPVRVIRVASRLRSAVYAKRANRRLRALVVGVGNDLSEEESLKSNGVTHRVISASSDRAVLEVSSSPTARVVVKAGWSDAAANSIGCEVAQINQLNQNPALTEWASVIPTVVKQGEVGDSHWLAQTLLPGASGDSLDLDPTALIFAAATALSPLHEQTKMVATADTELLNRLVDTPVAAIVAARPQKAAQLERFRQQLRLKLSGRKLVLGTVHGDFAPTNVLWDPDQGRVSAIVDWELAREEMPPELDLAHFGLVLATETSRLEYGQALAEYVEHGDTRLSDWLAKVKAFTPNGFEPSVALTLAWLHHCAANLTKTDDYNNKSVWLASNIDATVDALCPVNGLPNATLADSDRSPTLARLARRLRPTAAVSTPPLSTPPGSTPPVSTLVVSSPSRPANVSPPVAPGRGRWVAFALSAVTLLVALLQADSRALGEYGLVSIVPIYGLVAFVAMVGIAIYGIFVEDFSDAFAGTSVAGVVVAISAAPAIVYETTRFAWAYKHIGIVEYIARTGGVDTEINELAVYHNWPGFFAGAGSITEWIGLENAIVVAAWTPVVLNLLTLLGLVFLFAALTDSRRTLWLAALLFFLSNWIGQDYFSPQALGYVLYLNVIALVLRFYRVGMDRPPFAVHVMVTFMMFALIASHQLTPMVLFVALVGLVLLGQVKGRWLPLAAGALNILWYLSWARTFVIDNIVAELSGITTPIGNATESLGKAVVRSDAQELVALAGRSSMLMIGFVGMIGLALRIARGRNSLTPMVLLAAPASMAVLAFGGEILFRIALFMLPILCLVAAEGLRAYGSPLRHAALSAMVCIAFIPTLTLASFGKDWFFTFTEDELAVVAELSAVAPPNSLLVEGSRNYPAQFLNYENFIYVPIEREPVATHDRIAANPADELYPWLAQDGYAATYLLLTKSQGLQGAALGTLPPNFISEVEEALRSDERFEVLIEGEDAVVFGVSQP